MADVISWPCDLAGLNRVCSLLRSGRLVGVSTEAGFVGLASGLDPQAIERLAALAERDVPLAIGLGSAQAVFDWLPHLRGAAVRLLRDFWPGPFVLVSPLGWKYGLFERLPAAIRESLLKPEGLPVRLAPRDDLGELFSAVGIPLVIGSLTQDAQVDAVLDVEPLAPTASVTVAMANDREARLLRAGSVRPAEIEASRRGRVVFLCTGNTCRSPMASVLCERLLADTLGIEVSALAARGYEMASAGLAAAEGEPASPEAVLVARSFGADLSSHASQPLTMELVDRADHLFAMTGGHLRMLKSLRLPVGPEPQLLSAWGEDVPDPIGGPLELYQACAEQIRHSLRERLPQILEG